MTDFKTPILFLIFNRPEATERVFSKIRKQKPKYLFVAADGAREHKVDEKEKCAATRSIVIDNIDWDCEVKTLFRDTNLGCGPAVSGAITWFFENVEQGIILEDDCLPAGEFFPFCGELLERYKLDQRISIIAGTNLLGEWPTNNSYVFSFHAGIWGWATWKRVWDEYDVNITKWKHTSASKLFKKKINNLREQGSYIEGFDRIANGDVFTWDYQFLFLRLIKSSFGIIPKKNLVTNIGFALDATHTLDETSQFANLPSKNLAFPLQHPSMIKVNNEFDEQLSELVYPQPKRDLSASAIATRIIRKIGRILKMDNASKN